MESTRLTPDKTSVQLILKAFELSSSFIQTRTALIVTKYIRKTLKLRIHQNFAIVIFFLLNDD